MLDTRNLGLEHKYTKLSDQHLNALYNSIMNKIQGGNSQQNKMKTRKYFPNIHPNLHGITIMDRMKILVLEADKIVTSIITPWSLEKVKVSETTGLFLPIKDALTVIMCNSKTTTYSTELDLTEDMMFGIFCVVTEDYCFWLGDTCEIYKQKPIVVDDLLDNYTKPTKETKDTKRTKEGYTARTKFGKIYFDTKDFIEGVIMAAEWLNENPHNYITDVYQGDVVVKF